MSDSIPARVRRGLSTLRSLVNSYNPTTSVRDRGTAGTIRPSPNSECIGPRALKRTTAEQSSQRMTVWLN
jgi:hypothetical protein